MGDSAHTAHHTNPGKKSAPPLFLEDENTVQKLDRVVRFGIAEKLKPREPIFVNVLREKGGVLTLRTPIGFALTPTVLSVC